MDLFKERIQIEEDYAKRLAKLAKSPLDPQGFGLPEKPDEEVSSLKKAWFQVRAQGRLGASMSGARVLTRSGGRAPARARAGRRARLWASWR